MKPTPIEFLAYYLYQVDHRDKGAFVRWWCMDDKLKARYLKEANGTYEAWATAEEKAAKDANTIATG